MTFNEFQRELQKAGLEPKTAYFFTLLYERFAQIIKQQEDLGKALVVMAEQLQGFVELHEATQKLVKKIERGGRPDGVDVQSVAPDDDLKH